MPVFLKTSKEKTLKRIAQEGLLSAEAVREAERQAHQTHTSVFTLIAKDKNVPEQKMLKLLSDELDIPVLNLQAYQVPDEIKKIIPKHLIERYRIVPISKIDRLLTIGTNDPFNLAAFDEVRQLTQYDVNVVLVASKFIEAFFESQSGGKPVLEELLSKIGDDNLEVLKDDEDAELSGLNFGKVNADEAPIVKMVNLILNEAIKHRASDIHFEPYEHDFRVRYRIDGALNETFRHSRDIYPSIVARVKIVSQMDITEHRVPQDGRFRAIIQDREIDFRVSVLPIYHGEKIVLRVLDQSGVQHGLDQLGFTEKPTQIFAESVKYPYGMILVTGPTGSGKSTTLYSILNSLNTPDRNIMTVEDPIEYQVEGITQTQVNPEVGLSFATGLRCLLRQSPDVVLVGEIRDQETADIGVKAALTGHLVFSTLHTNSSAGAMTRLVDMGVEPFLIASSVICVAAQRLMRRICESCKEPYQIPAEILRRCGLKDQDLKNIQPYHGKGCPKCRMTGYYGRLGAIEVLRMTPDIRNLILQRKSSDEIEQKAIEQGMETLYENAFGLFKAGKTTLEEVLRISSHD